MVQRKSWEKIVLLDLLLQRHLKGPLENSLQNTFRTLLKHQWETNWKLFEHHMMPDLSAEPLQRQRWLSSKCLIPARVSAPVRPHPQNHLVLQHTVWSSKNPILLQIPLLHLCCLKKPAGISYCYWQTLRTHYEMICWSCELWLPRRVSCTIGTAIRDRRQRIGEAALAVNWKWI